MQKYVASQDGVDSSIASAYAERLPPKASLFRADDLYRVCQLEWPSFLSSWCFKTEERAMELGGGKRRRGETLLTKDEFGRCPRSFAPFVLPSSNRSLLVGQLSSRA